MTKVCKHCGLTKPLTEFYNVKTKDGKSAHCKLCYKQRHLNREARIIAENDPDGDIIEDNKLTKRENDLIREFLAKKGMK